MSDLLNGAEVPWDFLSSPVERRPVQPPPLPRVSMPAPVREEARRIADAAREVAQVADELLVAAACDGDGANPSLRRRITVAAAQLVARKSPR